MSIERLIGSARFFFNRNRSNSRRVLSSRSSEDGFGVAEAVIAAFVLGLLVIAISPVFTTVSKSTGLSTDEVIAAGIVRQQLSMVQQQLATDTGYTGNMASGPYPFPYLPGLNEQCYSTATNGPGSYTAPGGGLSAILCQDGGVGAEAPATGTSYCTSASGSITCSGVAPAGSFYYTSTITAEWVCEPGQYTQNYNHIPLFLVQDQVTWPTQGEVATPTSSITSAPPGGTQINAPSADPLTSGSATNTGNTPQCT